LAILAAANLVVAVWRGREKLHYLNPVPTLQISKRWIGKFERQLRRDQTMGSTLPQNSA
jgi:hypothetical protein